MNDTCGCCEGTQQLTPKLIANRPGLEAIAYRMGTHAAFLETLKARLSSFYLDTQQLEAEGEPTTTRLYPLRGLTTRAADDPSIALLDAWATLADVLTFYQERIANEGYLHTATERRSILELARLVGYALRPGVASTVYLAYTLDDNAREPVVIPVGARAQSVPGPGELPQSFETAENLEARVAWNLLKPRMTKPQTEKTIRDSPHPRVYLKGIDTNLKPNDPLLIEFADSARPVPYRVMDVKPDAAADRTLVTLQDWRGAAPAAPAVPSPEAITAETKRQLSAITARYLGEEAERINLSRGAMFGRVSAYLESLRQQLVEGVPFPAMLTHLNRETLPRLAEERKLAQDRGYTDLGPWLENMMAELSGVAGRASVMRAEALAREFTLAAAPGASSEIVHEVRWGETLFSIARIYGVSWVAILAANGLSDPDSIYVGQRLIIPTSGSPPIRDDDFKGAFEGLVKAPSVPPRNALVLKRDVRQAFQPKADTHLQMVSTFRADVRESLPAVAANIKVTPDVAIKVCAFRAKAAPFGHNAPPRPIRFDPDRHMVINGEWTISNPLNQAEPVARFLAYPRFGYAPLTVEFTDQSSGDIESYTWDFGDGTTSTIRNPAHRFEKADDYIVTLTVQGALGTDTVQSVIRVSEVVLEAVAPPQAVTPPVAVPTYHLPNIIFLDADYNISPQSWIAIDKPTNDEPDVIFLGEQSVTHQSLAAYGLSGKTTQLDLGTKTWLDDGEPFSTVRNTTVYAQSEELPLAEEPIDDPICGSDDAADPDAYIELDGVYSELQAGRWLIVSGERTDIRTPDPDDLGTTVPVPGVRSSELVMLAEVVQRVSEADQATPANGYYGYAPPLVRGEKIHTYIRLAKKLAYCYKRDTVKIYGNVIKATHGETRNEVLGSGDGSQAFQSFVLKQPPLTYVAAPTPAGAQSTLLVRVNDVEWHETDSLAGLGPTDRNFITRTDDESKTTVIFGNGQRGARPPTGIENIKAVYRNGIGKPGNVKAEQISLLVTRPLGVKEVINPIRASGGADREGRDQARKNAPLAVLALDRLVSTQDYADFARTFAGIGKASAARLTDGRRQLVHVTIAGADDIPIDESSDLYHNLVKALRDYGDPYQPIMVEVRELMLIVLSANVRIQPDYQWESVVTKVRAKLLDTFSFERRELGQDVLLSEVISTIQSVPGVAYVDVDMLGGVSEKDEAGPLRTPKEIADEVQRMIESQQKGPKPRVPVNLDSVKDGIIRAAQLAFLTPDVEATCILNEVKS
jgi:predicted phage baseplate assembly protein